MKQLDEKQLQVKREFIELFNQCGWSQAKVGRAIGMTRGGVNGVVTGPHAVSETALKAFRSEIAVENPKALIQQVYQSAELEPSEQKLINELRRLSESDRHQIYRVIKTMIAGFSKRSGSSAVKNLNSQEKERVNAAAHKAAAVAVLQVPHHSSGYLKKHKAASPSDKIGEPNKAVPTH